MRRPDRLLHGERTVVRPATAADAGLIAGWHADPDVARFWDGDVHTRDAMIERLARPNVDAYVVEADGEPIGYLQAWFGETTREGGLDMFLVPGMRGRGLGPDAARTLARSLLDEGGRERVTVDPYVWNEQGIRGWKNAGFRPVEERDADDDHADRWLLMEFEPRSTTSRSRMQAFTRSSSPVVWPDGYGPAMRRILALIVILAAAATAVVAFHATAAASSVRKGAQPIKVGGLLLPAKVKGNYVALAQDGAFAPHFWAGVNLGSTTPGTLPGQVAATRADYDRWIDGMGAANISVIRIYTILRPSFYDALAAYDSAHRTSPIFFIQGVWIPEAPFDKTGNAWDPAVTNGFKQEIRNAVNVVHGHATLPLIPGHAGGRYAADVSRWLLAWSPGIEWDPNLTRITLKKNARRARYVGRYITTTAKANTMESWLAMELDWLASLEAKEGWSRPLTFTNWLTDDPLHHPYEPLPREDMVSIDATHLTATKKWPGGFFASYHAYPYYPDFLRRTPAYAHYRRPWDGKIDPYAGYLRALKAYHRKQAVMITEFGVPSSIGIAHYGPAGRDQGDLSETQQAQLDAEMFEDLRHEGFAGGVMFEWVEEWFKFTWNTVDYQLPAVRRELWHDPMTNEQFFGIVAAEPGATPAVTLDGKDGEWTKNGSQVIAESRGPVREVRAVKDPEYLYLRLRLDQKSSWQKTPITIGFNVQPGGNQGLPGMHGFDPKAEVAITIGPGDRARIKEAAWIDPVLFQYAAAHSFIKFPKKALAQGSGVWVDPNQILNRPLTVPATKTHYGVELHSYANLGWGPESQDERNLVDGNGDVVELRIPYAMLGYSDPSSNQVLVPHLDGTMSSETVGRVGIAIAEGAQRLATTGYAWSQWQGVQWHERRKAGWPIFAQEFARANDATVG